MLLFGIIYPVRYPGMHTVYDACVNRLVYTERA